MKVFKTISSVQKQLTSLKLNKKLGFVATMGALHQGHISIVERAIKENDYVIVSIFINPTQFDKKEDLIKYPYQLESDLKLLKSVNCDFVFTPSVNEMYSSDIKSNSFDFEGLDEVMEGAHRKGHFDGVGTIVSKFFQIIKPTIAYFGKKDFQQLLIIKNMVRINNLPIKIIGCSIYREQDGLAMSSRNARLNSVQRKEVPLIYQTLLKSKILFQEKDINDVKKIVKNEINSNTELELEYFEIADTQRLKSIEIKANNISYRAFIAVNVGTIRLIDNIALN